MPRNTKINLEIIDIFRKMVAEENMLLACTDEDLVIMLNERLFVEHRISYRTFQRYKRRALKNTQIPDADPLYLDLFFILRRAYVELRIQMLKAMQADSYSARRYAWIMERKFKEWNLKWNAPEEEIDDDEGPIVEEETHYPTLVGKYHDINNTERPKDIMPVHYAVFNKYVVPNPDYDGDEDDNTREINRMWEYLKETERKDAEDELKRQERLLEMKRQREEQADNVPYTGQRDGAAQATKPNEAVDETDPWADIALAKDDLPEGMIDWWDEPNEEERLQAEAQRIRDKYVKQRKRCGLKNS